MNDEPQLDLDLPGDSSRQAEVVPHFSPNHLILLEQVAYSAQFGAGMQVVEGAQGSGKSLLAQALVKHYLGEDDAGLVDASSEDNADRFWHSAVYALGIPLAPHASAGDALVALRHHTEELLGGDRIAFLVVDNAHCLDQQQLAALASLLQGSRADSGLHLILWSEPGTVTKLDNLHLVDVPVHDFTIPPVPLAEAGTLLEKRLALSGAVGSSQVEQVWRESQGQMAKLLALGAERLKASASESGATESTPDSSSPDETVPAANLIGRLKMLPAGHLAAVLLLVTVLVWGVLSRDTEQADERVAVLPDPLAPVAATDTASTSTPGSPHPDEQPNQTPGAESGSLREVTEPTAAPEGRDQPEFSLEPVVDEEELRNALYPPPSSAAAEQPALSQPQAGSSAVSEPDVAEPQESAAAPAAEKPAAPIKAEAGGSGDEQTLLSFAGDSYSLQVMAAKSRQSLQDFRQQQPNRDQLYLYESRRQGKPWYVLLFGNFPDRASAVEARAQLPAKQRAAGPWPRDLASVHREINAVQ